jgi:hypothetical protein
VRDDHAADVHVALRRRDRELSAQLVELFFQPLAAQLVRAHAQRAAEHPHEAFFAVRIEQRAGA